MTSEERYPKIWKTEECIRGECLEERTQHWWSVPASTAFGLISECYHCHKLKEIH